MALSVSQQRARMAALMDELLANITDPAIVETLRQEWTGRLDGTQWADPDDVNAIAANQNAFAAYLDQQIRLQPPAVTGDATRVLTLREKALADALAQADSYSESLGLTADQNAELRAQVAAAVEDEVAAGNNNIIGMTIAQQIGQDFINQLAAPADGAGAEDIPDTPGANNNELPPIDPSRTPYQTAAAYADLVASAKNYGGKAKDALFNALLDARDDARAAGGDDDAVREAQRALAEQWRQMPWEEARAARDEVFANSPNYKTATAKQTLIGDLKQFRDDNGLTQEQFRNLREAAFGQIDTRVADGDSLQDIQAFIRDTVLPSAQTGFQGDPQFDFGEPLTPPGLGGGGGGTGVRFKGFNLAATKEESLEQFMAAIEPMRADLAAQFGQDGIDISHISGAFTAADAWLDTVMDQIQEGAISTEDAADQYFLELEDAFGASTGRAWNFDPDTGTSTLGADGSYTPLDENALRTGVGDPNAPLGLGAPGINPGVNPHAAALSALGAEFQAVWNETEDENSRGALTQGLARALDHVITAMGDEGGGATQMSLGKAKQMYVDYLNNEVIPNIAQGNHVPLTVTINGDDHTFNADAAREAARTTSLENYKTSFLYNLRGSLGAGIDPDNFVFPQDDPIALAAHEKEQAELKARVDRLVDQAEADFERITILEGSGKSYDELTAAFRANFEARQGENPALAHIQFDDANQIVQADAPPPEGDPPLGGHTLTATAPGDFGSGNALSSLVFQLTANATDQFADETLLESLLDMKDVFDDLTPNYQVDPVTGERILDADGNPILMPGQDLLPELDDFPEGSVEYMLLQAMQDRVGVGGTLTPAELKLFDVTPMGNAEETSLEALIVQVGGIFDALAADVKTAINTGAQDITLGDYLIERDYEVDDTGALLLDDAGMPIPKAFATGGATAGATAGETAGNALGSTMEQLLISRAGGVVPADDANAQLLAQLGVDIGDPKIFGPSQVDPLGLIADLQLDPASKTIGAVGAADTTGLETLLNQGIGGTVATPTGTADANTAITSPAYTLDEFGNPITPVAGFAPATTTTVAGGPAPKVSGHFTAGPGVAGGPLAQQSLPLTGQGNLAPTSPLAGQGGFQTGIDTASTIAAGGAATTTTPTAATVAAPGTLPAPVSGFTPGAAGTGIAAPISAAPATPVDGAPVDVLEGQRLNDLLGQGMRRLGDGQPLPGTDFLGDTSREGADVMLEALLSQAMGQLSPTQLAAERGARDSAAAGVEQFLAADPFQTGARGLRGGVNSALAMRERSTAATAFQQQMLQNRAALQQSATQNFLALRQGLSADELARIQTGADIDSLRFQRTDTLLNSVAGIELQTEANRLATQSADLDRQLQASMASGDRATQASIESAKLAVEQQIATNQQRLDALIEEGRIGVAGAELKQAADIQNQRAGLDAQLAQLNAEMQVAIANQDASLQASIEQERIQLEAQKADANLRLGALTEEGRQALEAESLNLTRAVEEASLVLQSSIANLNAQLASETVRADNELTASVESQRNSLIAKQQELDALIAEGELLLQTDQLVQQGDVSELQLLLDKQKHVDSINAQLAQAERDGDIELARTLVQMKDNEQARLLNAAIAGAELDQDERIEIRELVVNERLAEAGLRLNAILGNRQIAADVLATRTGSADFTAKLLADLSVDEKSLALDRSKFLDQLEFAKIELEEGTRVGLARLNLEREIDNSQTLLSSLNALGSLEATAGLGLLEAATSTKAEQADFILASEAQMADFMQAMAAGEINEEAFKDAIERADRQEAFQISSFLSGQFISQAALDLQQEQNATSAVAVAKQAEEAFAELALTRQKIELAIQQTDDINEQQALGNYAAAVDYLGNNLFGGMKDKKGESIGWLQGGLSVLGGIGGFILGGKAGAKTAADFVKNVI